MKRKVDIQDELSSISQAVANLTGKNPFTVPTNYFEQFPEKIRESASSFSTPQLELLPKENPFEVPQDYFQQFKVNKQKHKIIGVIKIRNVVRYAAAACITGVMVALFFLNDRTVKNELVIDAKGNQQTELSTDAVETYLSDAEILSILSSTDEFTEPEENSLVDLNRETVGYLLSELSENGLDQYINLNDINEINGTYN